MYSLTPLWHSRNFVSGRQTSIAMSRYRLCVVIVLTWSITCWLSSDAASAHTRRRQVHPARTATSSRRFIISPFSSLPTRWGTIVNNNHRQAQTGSGLLVAERIAALVSRGGSSVGEEGYSDDEYDEYDESEDESKSAAIDADDVQIEVKVEKFDELLVASPMTNLYASLAVMFLSRKIDLFHPTVVKIARFAFIAYLLVLQLFLLYVRIQAKLNNDRTPIELKNPLSSILQSQLGGGGDGGGGSMMKNLASSLLSSTSTVLEYDLKQARSMQSGLIFNMMFMWFLHFKMGQVQPLLISTMNGLIAMVYSPLFQVYVLGRNLERPFHNPALKRMQDAAAAQEEKLEELAAPTTATDNEEAEENAVSDTEAEDESEADEIAGEEEKEVEDEKGAGGSDSEEEKEEDEVKDLNSDLNEPVKNDNDETLTTTDATTADGEKSDTDKEDDVESDK